MNAATRTGEVVLGSGPLAVRIRFLECGGVDLRVGSRILSGNADMAATLSTVLDHPDPDEETLSRLGSRLAVMCALISSLVPHGVPLSLWGSSWEELSS